MQQEVDKNKSVPNKIDKECEKKNSGLREYWQITVILNAAALRISTEVEDKFFKNAFSKT